MAVWCFFFFGVVFFLNSEEERRERLQFESATGAGAAPTTALLLLSLLPAFPTAFSPFIFVHHFASGVCVDPLGLQRFCAERGIKGASSINLSLHVCACVSVCV